MSRKGVLLKGMSAGCHDNGVEVREVATTTRLRERERVVMGVAQRECGSKGMVERMRYRVKEWQL